MKEIVHFIPGVRRGTGTGEALRSFALGLSRLEYPQRVVCVVADGPFLDVEGVQVHQVPTFGLGRLAVPRVGLDIHSELAIIHGGWNMFPVWASRWCTECSVPYVLTTHGVYDDRVMRRHRFRKAAWLWAFEKPYVGSAAAIHTTSAAEYATIQDNFVRIPPMIQVPNAVEVPEIQWRGSDSDYLVWLGRFDIENKGLDLLVEAIAYLPPSERPRVRLHGRGPKQGKERLATIIDRLEVGNWIHIGGFVEDAEKWELLAKARGFVFPSRWEAFGMALAEAAALGVPCVATPIPLAQQLARKGALLLSQPSSRDLAGSIQMLLERGGEMSRTARLVMESSYSPVDVARVWIDQARELGLL